MSLTPEQLKEGLALADVSASPVDEHPSASGPDEHPEVIPEPIGIHDTHRMKFETALEKEMYEAHLRAAVRGPSSKFKCYGGVGLNYER